MSGSNSSNLNPLDYEASAQHPAGDKSAFLYAFVIITINKQLTTVLNAAIELTYAHAVVELSLIHI